MAQMQTVTVPGTKIRAQVPATYSDAQVRKALALQYKKATGFGVEQAPVVNPPLNRPIPQSNEAYWKQRLAGQGNLKAGDESWRGKATSALAGLADGSREAYRMAEKVTGLADFVPGVGEAIGLNEAWGDLKRGVNTANPYTVGAAMLTGAATLLPGALDKPVKRGLGELMAAEDGAIRAWHGSPQANLDRIAANPPARQYDNATSQFGAFFGPNEQTAKHYAGPDGRIYETELDFANPYEMDWSDFARFQAVERGPNGERLGGEMWGKRAEELKAEAEAFRRQLEAQGHDGLIVRGRRGDIKEIASFRDVPLR